MRMNAYIYPRVCFYVYLYNIHFVVKFLGFTCICIRKKNILPSQVPTLSSKLKLQVHAITCFIIVNGNVFGLLPFPSHSNLSNIFLEYFFGVLSRNQTNLSCAQSLSWVCHVLANGKSPQTIYICIYSYSFPSINNQICNKFGPWVA